jgi:GGDEF domain-containing protein
VISIGQSVKDLEWSDRLRQTTFDCYVAAIQDAAHYAIELEAATTGAYRQHLETLAAEVSATDAASLSESRGTFRGLLRDYRDKAARFIGNLREELASGARALEEILRSLTRSDGDHEVRLRESIERLREISNSPAGAGVRDTVLATSESIGRSVEEIRKQHDLSIAQFQMEIHMLHKRIDGLEMAAMIDSLSKLFTRAEMEERIRAAPAEWYALLLIRATGVRAAEVRFGAAAAGEVAAALGKRLRNSLPADATLGRWGPEEFVAKVGLAKREAFTASKWVAENLSGAYSCLLDGKTVRPSIQVSVAVVDREPGEPPQRTCARIAEFFGNK